MSKYGDLPERGKINMAVNVFGINIQSADIKLPQQEATYKTMKRRYPSWLPKICFVNGCDLLVSIVFSDDRLP
jgi:hypothetical protein